MADELRYTFETPTRYLLRRGVDNLITARWSYGASHVAPTPGTITITRAGGTAVVTAAAFTVAADGVTAEYTLDAADTASLSLAQGWLVVWSVEMPDGTTREFVSEAALVRYRIAPPASVADLYQRQSRLDPAHPSSLTRDMDLGEKVRNAWQEIEDRLFSQGRRPELVMTPGVFRVPHVLLALAHVYEDLRSSNYTAYADTAAGYRREFEAVFGRLVFAYDADEDGLVDGGSAPDREGTRASVWLTDTGGWRWR